MTNLVIGNESINTRVVKQIIRRNITHCESKIATLNLNSKTGVRMLAFYSDLIKNQQIMLEWIIYNEKAKQDTEKVCWPTFYR